ncbi:hypothetical protein C8F04DRAFT_1230449 [Mycena alexandri]|uniref:Uncharacterized protein n=1 Tax=Mycena alexandri TaxID=1745969 RepID=A0AAD6T9M0_9AGAR|nr:hypothetical protein C8F04DRAFT_1230449 [Mycena alexandri]
MRNIGYDRSDTLFRSPIPEEIGIYGYMSDHSADGFASKMASMSHHYADVLAEICAQVQSKPRTEICLKGTLSLKKVRSLCGRNELKINLPDRNAYGFGPASDVRKWQKSAQMDRTYNHPGDRARRHTSFGPYSRPFPQTLLVVKNSRSDNHSEGMMRAGFFGRPAGRTLPIPFQKYSASTEHRPESGQKIVREDRGRGAKAQNSFAIVRLIGLFDLSDYYD